MATVLPALMIMGASRVSGVPVREVRAGRSTGRGAGQHGHML